MQWNLSREADSSSARQEIVRRLENTRYTLPSSQDPARSLYPAQVNVAVTLHRSLVRTSVGTPAILGLLSGFPQSLQANGGEVLDYFTIASFQIIPNSSFTTHHILDKHSVVK